MKRTCKAKGCVREASRNLIHWPLCARCDQLRRDVIRRHTFEKNEPDSKERKSGA